MLPLNDYLMTKQGTIPEPNKVALLMTVIMRFQ